MQRAAQHALEFHRIVEAVRSLRRDAPRPRPAGVAPPAVRPAPRRAVARGDHRGRPLPGRRRRCFRSRRRRTSTPRCRRSPSRAARSSRSGCSGWPISCRRSTRRAPPSGGRPAATCTWPPSSEMARVVQDGGRRHPGEDRRGRRRERPGERRAPVDPRPAAEAARAAAEHAGVLPARPRHGAVPAGPDRHRPQRPVRARRPRRAPVRHPGHHPRQFGERRQPLPRAAQHGRDQQRRGGARRAGGGRSPAHPAGAHRRVPPPGARPAADAGGGDRAGRGAGESAVLPAGRRRRAGDDERRGPGASRGTASAADSRRHRAAVRRVAPDLDADDGRDGAVSRRRRRPCGCRDRRARPGRPGRRTGSGRHPAGAAGERAGHHRARTRAARRWRSRPPGCWP